MSRNTTPSILSTLTAYDSTDEEDEDGNPLPKAEGDLNLLGGDSNSNSNSTPGQEGQVTVLFPTPNPEPEINLLFPPSSYTKKDKLSILSHTYEEEENFEYQPDSLEEEENEEEQPAPTQAPIDGEENSNMSKNVENSEGEGDEKKTEVEFHVDFQGRKRRKIEIPPEPSGSCAPEIQQRFAKLLAMKLRGKNPNKFIQQMKDFRNPSIYEKFIDLCDIDENGTNFPDQPKWHPSSYYDELDKAQRLEMERRLKEKEKKAKEAVKVDFVMGTAKKPSDLQVQPQPQAKPPSAYIRAFGTLAFKN